jgi:hypothetical protein
MAFELVFTERYRRVESRFLRRHPEVRRQYGKTLLLLESKPFHPSPRLHPLQRHLAGRAGGGALGGPQWDHALDSERVRQGLKAILRGPGELQEARRSRGHSASGAA